MPGRKDVTGMAVVLKMMGLVVADVRLRQEHAAETTSHAKYTTAAGAVEHDGAGGGEEVENVVGVGVGVGVGVTEVESVVSVTLEDDEVDVLEVDEEADEDVDEEVDEDVDEDEVCDVENEGIPEVDEDEDVAMNVEEEVFEVDDEDDDEDALELVDDNLEDEDLVVELEDLTDEDKTLQLPAPGWQPVPHFPSAIQGTSGLFRPCRIARRSRSLMSKKVQRQHESKWEFQLEI
ncbi:hypothetical protein CC86DRAFT_404189 [Ophiobolus disseminans]|uniref:Uncharacterized protein n=1 Tax=Ophiobolus disseminans TaxID=1469910 RepID=A0A6A7A9N8_9PLEO|nr:hypothetical protein CC86DRAFT_404189 [Ophiobolus disseminans]